MISINQVSAIDVNSTKTTNSTVTNSTILTNSTVTNSTILTNSTVTNSTILTNSTVTNSTILTNNTVTNSTILTNSTVTNSTKTVIVLSDQLGVVDRIGITHISSHRIDLTRHDASYTTNLRNLTISAWVKPDFSQGSSVFTIVSQENAFALAINNNMPPSKTPLFSIFDGIKWTSIQSNSTIPEQWTYLTATFNGTSITLYVNDKLEGTMQISGIPTITKSGYLETKIIQNITSN